MLRAKQKQYGFAIPAYSQQIMDSSLSTVPKGEWQRSHKSTGKLPNYQFRSIWVKINLDDSFIAAKCMYNMTLYGWVFFEWYLSHSFKINSFLLDLFTWHP